MRDTLRDRKLPAEIKRTGYKAGSNDLPNQTE
jgi:hypothetical protein